MSTENDVPLGEGSRRYYEEKFGDRIRQVNKSGGSAPNHDRGGSTGTGRAGCGVAIAILVAIRVISAILNSHSHTSPRSYTPPPQPPPPFIGGMEKHWDGVPAPANKAPQDDFKRTKR